MMTRKQVEDSKEVAVGRIRCIRSWQTDGTDNRILRVQSGYCDEIIALTDTCLAMFEQVEALSEECEHVRKQRDEAEAENERLREDLADKEQGK